MIRVFRLFLPLLSLWPALPVAAADPVGGAFFDPFDRFDRGRWYVSDGWTNGPHQACHWSSRAVGVTGGQLELSFLPAAGPGGQHLCGEVQTRAIHGHGTFEARLTAEAVSGMNSAFFTYIGPVHGKPHDEIDIEILGRDGPVVSLNRFVAGQPITPVELPVANGVPVTVAFRWAPDRITWYLDGQPIHEEMAPLPQTPQKIYFSIWATETLTGWMGPFAVPQAPVVLRVDWVGFTPLGAPCAFPDSLVCKLP